MLVKRIWMSLEEIDKIEFIKKMFSKNGKNKIFIYNTLNNGEKLEDEKTN